MTQAQEKIKKPKSSSASHYVPESLPLAYCDACLMVALEQSRQAREIYSQIIESFSKPDMQKLFETLANGLPPGQKRLKEPTQAPNNKDNSQLPDSATLERLKNTASTYINLFRDVLDFRRGRIKSEDVKLWKGLIEELIRVGFNNQEDQGKGLLKITDDNSIYLFSVIHIRALADYRNTDILNDKDGNTRGLKNSVKTQDLIRPFVNSNARAYRATTKNYAGTDDVLKRDNKLMPIAERWYQCRVVHASITSYCDEMLLKKCIELDPAGISNEIRECDQAMGYPRGNTELA